MVALCRIPQFENATVHADPLKNYRWDWVRGLPNVVVLMDSKTRIGPVINAIHNAGPDQLDVLDIEVNRGWMVLYTSPKLVTVKWRPAQVADWLGEQIWHSKLNSIKAAYGLTVA